VSAVIFLNDVAAPGETDADGVTGFTGGYLHFYRLSSRPTWHDYCSAVAPTAGRLIGFETSAVHEVTPVLSGERYSIATWFERRQASAD